MVPESPSVFLVHPSKMPSTTYKSTPLLSEQSNLGPKERMQEKDDLLFAVG